MNTDKILEYLPLIITITSTIYYFLKARKAGKTMAEALHVAINTLKVEDKMEAGAFKAELVDKVEAVSQALNVSNEAKQQVTKVLNSGHELDIKLGSIKGKPIYLGDVTGIGSALAAALQKIRGIRIK